MKIIADTATLFSPAEGRELGLTVIPVCAAVNGKAYRDFEEITAPEFLRMIAEGGIPSTSQPALGDILDEFEADEQEIVFLAVGSGLSGAYATAEGARSCVENPGRIHIIDSGSLAGPLRYMAKKAVALRNAGESLAEICRQLQRCAESSVSFVIPADFEFLKRSGRLTPLAAGIGGVLRLLPILTQTEDRTRITPVGVKRSWQAAIEVIIRRLQALGVGAGHLISVCHTGTVERAQAAASQLREHFAASEIEMLELSPALIAHGGPGCIVVQAVLK